MTDKEKQLDIILKENPVQDDYHTWIRSVDDIHTFEEALEYDDYEGGNVTPDYTEKMIEEAKKTGVITVYSSHPIQNGNFVTPSKMEAQSYAGPNAKIYSAEVKLTDIAWIDSIQGQYAKTEPVKIFDKNTSIQDRLDFCNKSREPNTDKSIRTFDYER